jgi:hypothetical protein
MDFFRIETGPDAGALISLAHITRIVPRGSGRGVYVSLSDGFDSVVFEQEDAARFAKLLGFEFSMLLALKPSK